MSDKQTISALLQELEKTVSIRGISSTIVLLKNGRHNLSNDKHIQFVVLSVLNQFSITIEQLRSEKSEASKYAKGFIIYYLRSDFKISIEQIKILLRLSRTRLWVLMMLVKELKPNLSSDIPYCNIRKSLDKTIAEYKLTTNQ